MPSISHKSFTKKVLALYEPPVRAKSTYDTMARVLRHVRDLGNRNSYQLTPELVARYVSLRSRQVRANTVVGELGYLKAACAWAAEEGYLPRSPFRGKRSGPTAWMRPAPPRRQPYHSIVELSRVLAHLEDQSTDWAGRRLHALVALVALTGLRRDEALYAHAEDVDLELRILRVMGRKRLKTVDSAAPVPLCDDLAEILGRWLPDAGTPWLFPGIQRKGPWSGGQPGSKPLDRLKAAGLAVGVEGLTFQSLRHSWGTHAESAWGLSGPLIQRVLRHTSERTSRVHYRHPELVNLAASVRSISYRRGA